MVDIKVGDWVKANGWSKFYEVVESEGNNITVLNSWGKRYSYSLEDYDFIIRENPTPSPVREVVTKELVDGVYGRVLVDGVYGRVMIKEIQGEPTFNIVNRFGECDPLANMQVLNAKELRELAQTLNEVAEFLESE